MRVSIKQYENFVDRLDTTSLNPGEHYYVKSKTNPKELLHYIVNDDGKVLLVNNMATPTPTTSSEKVYTCGEDVNSFMPVVLIGGLLYKMNILNPTHQFGFVGFTKTSAIAGNTVVVEREQVYLSGWNLVPSQQYLAGIDGGMLTENNIPNSFTKVIGLAQTNNILLIIKNYTSINKQSS